MSDHPPEQLDPQVGSGSPNSTVCIKKRKLREFLGSPKSNQSLRSRPPSQQSTGPSTIVSQVITYTPGDNHSVVSPPVTQDVNLESSLQSSLTNISQVVMDVFPDNVPKPVIKIELPLLQERLESTEQLVYCTSLLLQDSFSIAAIPGDD
ncbi:hypothetical protein BGZ95_007005, partial [Linnemannia exigua]